jgi:hypothetical protein
LWSLMSDKAWRLCGLCLLCVLGDYHPNFS